MVDVWISEAYDKKSARRQGVLYKELNPLRDGKSLREDAARKQ